MVKCIVFGLIHYNWFNEMYNVFPGAPTAALHTPGPGRYKGITLAPPRAWSISHDLPQQFQHLQNYFSLNFNIVKIRSIWTLTSSRLDYLNFSMSKLWHFQSLQKTGLLKALWICCFPGNWCLEAWLIISFNSQSINT